jgi:hypothetical protein
MPVLETTSTLCINNVSSKKKCGESGRENEPKKLGHASEGFVKKTFGKYRENYDLLNHYLNTRYYGKESVFTVVLICRQPWSFMINKR